MGKQALRTAVKVDLKADPATLPYLHASNSVASKETGLTMEVESMAPRCAVLHNDKEQ